MKKMLNWLASEESGQGMVEYGLILALVACAVVAAIGLMGTNLNSMFDKINANFSGKS